MQSDQILPCKGSVLTRIYKCGEIYEFINQKTPDSRNPFVHIKRTENLTVFLQTIENVSSSKMGVNLYLIGELLS